MKKYRIMLQGKGLLMDMGNGPARQGFLTTRYVEAESPEKAEVAAADLVRNDSELRTAILNEKNDPPMIYSVEVVELESFEAISVPGKGYGFYPEDNPSTA
jgi:hypothetical protein